MPSNRMKLIQCYNCGNTFPENEITRDHIPAKNLFEGFGEEYRINRITVPSCLKCNQEYSPTDEEFRNMIGIIARRAELNSIAEKAGRSIKRKDPDLKRLKFNSLGKVTGVLFDKFPIENFHKKNFKGLFYHHYGYALPFNFELLVNIEENDWSEVTLSIIGYLTNNFSWKHSGHPDILKYIIQPMRPNLVVKKNVDLIPNNSETSFIGLLTYNETHAALVIAIDSSFLHSIAP